MIGRWLKRSYNEVVADLIPSLSSPSPKSDDINKFFEAIDVYLEVVDEVLAESKAANNSGRHDEAQRLLKTVQKLLQNVRETQEIVKRLSGFGN